MRHKKILVLGATGFIGGHIARAALDENWEVIGFRRDETRIGHLKGYPIHWVQGDLMYFDSLYAAMTGVDVVFHAAAFYPKQGNPRLVTNQVTHAKREIKNVIKAALKAEVSRLIYTSTLTTIGLPSPHEDRLADERDFYTPGTLAKSGYYEAKIAMESIFLDACSHDLPGIVLNPTAVFGPGDVNLTMTGLLIAVAKGWMVGWLPGVINVVDVRDVAATHIAAVSNGKIGMRYIIGGHNYTVRNAICEAAKVAGVRRPRFEIPLWILRGLTLLGDFFPMLPLPTNHLRGVHLWQGYNNQKAQQEFGFSPRNFSDTVRDSLAWLRKFGHI